MRTLEDPLVVVKALALYLYNVDPYGIVTDVYGDNIHVDYRDEKVNRFQTASFASFWGDLDSTRQRRFVEAVMQRYGDEARLEVLTDSSRRTADDR